MKYLKYPLYLIAILLIIFFGNGLITSSITYENKVEVNKPVAEVWAVMQDQSRVSEWLTVIERVEHVSGTPGTVGAVSHIYVNENGEEMMMEETITAMVPKEHMAMTFTMDFMDMDYAMYMTEVDGVTKLRTTSTTVGNGIFAQSIISFMTGTMEEQEDENLNRLKEVIENNQKQYSLD